MKAFPRGHQVILEGSQEAVETALKAARRVAEYQTLARAARLT